MENMKQKYALAPAFLAQFPRVKRIARALDRHRKIKLRLKPQFKRADEALSQAIHDLHEYGLRPPCQFVLPDGDRVEVVDVFADKISAFSAKKFDRFAVEEVKPEKDGKGVKV